MGNLCLEGVVAVYVTHRCCCWRIGWALVAVCCGITKPITVRSPSVGKRFPQPRRGVIMILDSTLDTALKGRRDRPAWEILREFLGSTRKGGVWFQREGLGRNIEKNIHGQNLHCTHIFGECDGRNENYQRGTTKWMRMVGMECGNQRSDNFSCDCPVFPCRIQSKGTASSSWIGSDRSTLLILHTVEYSVAYNGSSQLHECPFGSMGLQYGSSFDFLHGVGVHLCNQEVAFVHPHARMAYRS
mgnify:CR=1 FL=1